ncbi:MAG TPA: hypothetical protein V6D50_22305 [Chroococcales cyanobacterium]
MELTIVWAIVAFASILILLGLWLLVQRRIDASASSKRSQRRNLAKEQAAVWHSSKASSGSDRTVPKPTPKGNSSDARTQAGRSQKQNWADEPTQTRRSQKRNSIDERTQSRPSKKQNSADEPTQAGPAQKQNSDDEPTLMRGKQSDRVNPEDERTIF